MSKISCLSLLAAMLPVLIACQSTATSSQIERIQPEDVRSSIEARQADIVSSGVGCLQGNCEKGQGIYAYSENVIYKGIFAEGKRNGQGTLEYANGDVYTGGFSADRRSGQGKYLFGNGDYYNGEFADGQRSGKGLYSFASGGVFEGEFTNDGKSGNGLFFLNDKETLNCELKDFALICQIDGKDAILKKMQIYQQNQPAIEGRFEGNR